MPKITLIGRLSDGLPLAASMADDKDAYAGELGTYERQAKKIIRSLSQDPDAQHQQHNTTSEHVTLDAGDYFSFHYVIDRGVIFLTLTEKAYPKRLAHDYLEELRMEFGTVYGSQVAAASRPYEFIRFDTFIQKTKRVYLDARTQRNVNRLQTELRDVHAIMTKNISDVLGRGEKIENVAVKSSRLANESKRYASEAQHANRMRLVRQYVPIAAVVIVVLLVLWWFRMRS
mmetsp:Transcript_13754/g.35104  ORF Transcript_13754/g.35104 Transcript_13754/m.35104 type:complete len:230 (+) Transcript_13754:157-846(+)|eukprot:CAMPEP_0174886084 /NCGR_PEP_ID=MMETSP0167-20121228/1353_1 /TAXON_ID=38298 /ORGANISM="Rhodella maculata, Strain CCMP736" /LENGTH=229 /DNA_ID=CAMNT_0016121935 /DNA_START=78 /DNA_END=767 /DNA_ORIENTATION=+